jgi:peptidoglycan hydrolase FlgJ
MDIGKINNSTLGSLSNNTAAQTADKVSDDSFEKQLKAAVASKDDKALKSVCQQFEGIMLNMVYKGMKATIDKSDLMEEDPGTEIFQSMQDDNMMEEASKTGTFGLAESLYKQLSKQLGSGGKNNESKVEEKNKIIDK